MRRALALVALLAVVPGLAACQRPGPGRGEARLLLGEGDDVAGAYRDGSMVQSGEVVRALRGEPQLELSGRHRRLTLRRGTEVRLAGDDTVQVLRGDVLSEGESDIDAGYANVEADGVVRVTLTLASSVRVYDGHADVSSAGRSLLVPPRRDASVPGLGLVPLEPKWVTFDPADGWDRRYLGTVIELTEQLEAGSRSFTSTVRGTPSVDVSGLVNGLPNDAWSDALSRYAPGEALVGGVISAVAQRPLSSVFELRAEGAVWGIVAIERVGGDPARAVRSLYDALDRLAQRAGPSALRGTRGVALDVDDGTEVLGGSSAGGSGSGPAGSGSSGSGSAGSGRGGATTTTTVPPVTVPTVTVPTVTVPPIEVPTITVPPGTPLTGATLAPVPELP